MRRTEITAKDIAIRNGDFIGATPAEEGDSRLTPKQEPGLDWSYTIKVAVMHVIPRELIAHESGRPRAVAAMTPLGSTKRCRYQRNFRWLPMPNHRPRGYPGWQILHC